MRWGWRTLLAAELAVQLGLPANEIGGSMVEVAVWVWTSWLRKAVRGGYGDAG